MLIAIVEDDEDQSIYLKTCLTNDGYELAMFDNTVSLLRAMRLQVPDVVLLDWNLPQVSGIQLLKHLRSQGSQVAVIMVTARNDEESLVEALNAGADDFIKKPVRPAELRARIRALSRRLGHTINQGVVQVGQYVIDSSLHLITVADKPVILTEKEFQLASILLLSVGELFQRTTLLKRVWALDEGVSTRSLDTHILKIRRKLGLNGEYGLQLKAVYQLGYRLEPCN